VYFGNFKVKPNSLSDIFNKFLSLPLGGIYQNPRQNTTSNQNSPKHLKKGSQECTKFYSSPLYAATRRTPKRAQTLLVGAAL
jgi:hypothetical protein